MKKDFYVYILLDPRKKGIYNYKGYSFSFEPFYVGKGRGYRAYVHTQKNRNGTLCYKTLKIKKIKKENLNPIVIKHIEGISEKEALIIERELIKIIGRKCSGKGPLTNMSEGGRGNAGYKHTFEAKKKIKINNSRFWKGKKKSEETKRKISEKKKYLYKTGQITHPMKGTK